MLPAQQCTEMIRVSCDTANLRHYMEIERGEKMMKEQMKNDATLFIWPNVTLSWQTFILGVLEKEGERQREREYDDFICSPTSLPSSTPPSFCSEWGDECVCLSQFLLIVWSRAGGVKAKEGWDLSLSLFPSHTHTELKLTLPESPDVAEVEFTLGRGSGSRGKGVRGRRQSQQQSFKQHTDGFTTYMMKQTTHRAPPHSGVKDRTWTDTHTV